MNILTAEMKAELAAKKQAAEINAKIRTKKPEPKFGAPDNRPVRVLPEAKEDPYKRANPVSNRYDTIEFEVITDNYIR
jgi:hypothetical protein